MTGPIRLDGIKVCVFDAYGTLLDVHAPMARLAHALGPEASAISALWRQKQLEYTWLRSLMGAHADFERVTEDALDYALDSKAIADPCLKRRLLDLYLVLDPYPDAAPALEMIKRAGLATAILSNGSKRMLDRAVGSASLGPLLDDVLSIDAVGIYKPAPQVYALATARFGIAPEAVCFVSGNGWDGAGAAQFGFRVVRLDRAGLPRERLPAGPVTTIKTLTELPPLIA